MQYRFFRSAALLVLPACLAACSGGDSGSPSQGGSTPVVTPPVVVPPPVTPPPEPPPPVVTPPVVPDPVASPPPAGLQFIAAGIDSLTAGGGPDSWRAWFARSVRGGTGDGGPGYEGFSSQTTGEFGAVMTLTGGMAEFGIRSAQGKYSIDGFGIGVEAATGNAGFNWRPSSAWKQARLYYLKQPGGGTMRCGNALQPDNERTLVNTAAAAPDLGHIDIAFYPRSGGDSFGCSAMTGKLTVFGSLTTLGPGLIMANWAEGGRWIRYVADQDSAMRRKWFAELRPDYYFFNGGSNGIGIYTLAEHEAELRLIIGDIRTASPGTVVYIVQPNDQSDMQPRDMDPYAAIKRNVATSLGARFVDNREVLGSYADALAAGYMSDKVHLSSAGYRRVGEFYARLIGLFTATPDPGPTPYPPPPA